MEFVSTPSSIDALGFGGVGGAEYGDSQARDRRAMLNGLRLGGGAPALLGSLEKIAVGQVAPAFAMKCDSVRVVMEVPFRDTIVADASTAIHVKATVQS